MENIEIKIDYFSATFPLDCDADDSIMFKVHEMVKLMAQYLNVKNFEIAKSKYAQNNFNYQYQLGEHMILRLDGPMNDCYQRTCHLELKGEGCRDFEIRNPKKTWTNFLLFMVQLNARFKRIDIAIDDYSGKDVTLGWLYEKFSKRRYTSVFRSPVAPHGSLDTGLTLQFGSNESPIELVIYDKLAERKKRKKECDKTYWVRYEMRFRNDLAERIAHQLIATLKGDDYATKFSTFTFEQLYRIIDIKEENNYSIQNQKKAKTDPRWLAFLDNVEKGILPKVEDGLPKTFNQYMKAAIPYVSMFLLLKYLEVDQVQELFEIEIYKFMKDQMKFSKQRFQRLNIYLNQLNIQTIDDFMMAQLKDEFAGIIDERELPF